MKYALVFWLSFIFVPISYASCGSEPAYFFYYKAGKLVSKGKGELTQCGNIYNVFENWSWGKNNAVQIDYGVDCEGDSSPEIIAEWKKQGLCDKGPTLNGQPYYGLEVPLRGTSVCYGVQGTDEIFCKK